MDLAVVEHVLVEKQKELTARVVSVDKDFSSGRDADSAERAIEMENEPVLAELRREASEELLQIDQALGRLKVGLYGQCATCGEDISTNRLQAVPYAVKCINCAN
jgi:RNA polymerase-binding transcription factor DksA